MIRTEFVPAPPQTLPAMPLSHFQTAAYAALLPYYGQKPIWARCCDDNDNVLATWLLFESPANYLKPPSSVITKQLDRNLMTVHGPVMAPLPPERRNSVRDNMLRSIAAHADARSCLSTQLLLDPDLNDDERAGWASLAQLEGFVVSRSATYIADVVESEEKLFAAIKPDRRTKIRKAERCGLAVVENNDGQALQTYSALRGETTRRNGVADVSWSHILDTSRGLAGTNVFRLFTAVSSDGKPLAAQIAFAGPQYVYLSGVSLSDEAIAQGIPANDFLQWRVLNWAREHGFKMVDFGGAQPDSHDAKIKAIDSFKARWGTRLALSLRLQRSGSSARRLALRVAKRLVG